jgi:hypothetical protein
VGLEDDVSGEMTRLAEPPVDVVHSSPIIPREAKAGACHPAIALVKSLCVPPVNTPRVGSTVANSMLALCGPGEVASPGDGATWVSPAPSRRTPIHELVAVKGEVRGVVRWVIIEG